MNSTNSRRRLDVAGLTLFLIGLVSGLFSYWLITSQELNALIIIPSVIAVTTGAAHVTKREAVRS